MSAAEARREGKERPILFSGRMVRAILDRRKTVTRRIIDPQPEQNSHIDSSLTRPPGAPYSEVPAYIWRHSGLTAGYCHTSREAMERLMLLLCPYGAAGDRLWVREQLIRPDGDAWLYKADQRPVMVGADRESEMLVWAHHKQQDYCPSIHMPRWASRILLEIVDVSVERIQEISEAQAKSEGVELTDEMDGLAAADLSDEHRVAFRILWDSINLSRGPWSSNPFVWCVSFRRLRTAR